MKVNVYVTHLILRQQWIYRELDLWSALQTLVEMSQYGHYLQSETLQIPHIILIFVDKELIKRIVAYLLGTHNSFAMFVKESFQ